MNIKVVVMHGDDGFFVATCPSLKSCWSQGRTREEALDNLREAVELHLEPDPESLVEEEGHEVVVLAL